MKEQLYCVLRGLLFIGCIAAAISVLALLWAIHPACVAVIMVPLFAWLIGNAI